jgi:hypothetical protein
MTETQPGHAAFAYMVLALLALSQETNPISGAHCI